jgi:3-deoxy-D-manno-octulosonate 8-phosphate phosphatase KdsC-like HAD superfamily phosphatase
MPAIKRIAKYVTKRKGGDGAVRELCDMILAARTRENRSPARMTTRSRSTRRVTAGEH